MSPKKEIQAQRSKSSSKPQNPTKSAKDKDDLVDEASRESFPASDAPAWTNLGKPKQKS